MADGTTMNPGTGGDTISNKEFVVAADAIPAHPRGISDVPTTAYKLPRSKIAVGPYDADNGDATPVNPLPVQMFYERHLLEDMMIEAVDQTSFAQRNRACERISLCDRRGSSGQRGLR